MGALITLFTLPSFTSTTEQKAASENKQAVVTGLESINLSNVLYAYEKEVNASAKYAAYSEQARQEGNYEIALLFKAISKASDIHAQNHKAVLEEAGELIPEVNPEFKVNSTRENLKRAIALEKEQVTNMYPHFIIDAVRANHHPAKKTMSYAYLNSHKHKVLFEKALNAMNSNDMELLATTYFVCPGCGNVYEHDVNPFCAFCERPYWDYIRISDYQSSL